MKNTQEIRKERLTQLHTDWNERCVCKLKNTALCFVPGVGNPDADIVFIGEAPGKNEDEQGIPFVGRAGKFLDEMLASIKLERKDVYITNTVKYRPPNNRDPFPHEKEECFNWLADELNFIKPKIIVTLGRHALNNFLPEAQISEVHGQLLEKYIQLPLPHEKFAPLSTSYFFALYHPAAALYNGSLRETLLRDFKKIPNLLKKLAEK